MQDAAIPTEIKETITLLNGLLDDLQKPARELDELTFKRDFLPLLTSKEDVDLRAWVAIAGSPNGRVSVYRMENGKKKELYVVPPLINLNGFTKTEYLSQDSVYERMHNAIRRIRNAPMQAKMIYDDEMSKAAVDGVKLPLADALQWDKILELNGLKAEAVIASKTSAGNDRKTIVTDGWYDF